MEKIFRIESGIAMIAVHLHVRGENFRAFIALANPRGSSPRAWRKFSGFRPAIRQCRFISTCVEKMPLRPPRRPASAVHLHVRGENVSVRWIKMNGGGSSPRAWRKYRQKRVYSVQWRFISTCVEKIGCGITPASIAPVHLHVRGENLIKRSLNQSQGGSSPRAWRKFNFSYQGIRIKRFISTCVEKIEDDLDCGGEYAVHLHVRGENTRF